MLRAHILAAAVCVSAIGPSIAGAEDPKTIESAFKGSWTGPITIITTGKPDKVKMADGAEHWSIQFHGEAKEWRADSAYKKLFLSEKELFSTNGAILESKGKAGIVLEVIDASEFAKRFPKHVEKNRKLASAAGFCSLMGGGGNYYCDKATCTGSCTLHSIPVYCSCD